MKKGGGKRGKPWGAWPPGGATCSEGGRGGGSRGGAADLEREGEGVQTGPRKRSLLAVKRGSPQLGGGVILTEDVLLSPPKKKRSQGVHVQGPTRPRVKEKRLFMKLKGGSVGRVKAITCQIVSAQTSAIRGEGTGGVGKRGTFVGRRGRGENLSETV